MAGRARACKVQGVGAEKEQRLALFNLNFE